MKTGCPLAEQVLPSSGKSLIILTGLLLHLHHNLPLVLLDDVANDVAVFVALAQKFQEAHVLPTPACCLIDLHKLGLVLRKILEVRRHDQTGNEMVIQGSFCPTFFEGKAWVPRLGKFDFMVLRCCGCVVCFCCLLSSLFPLLFLVGGMALTSDR